MLVGASHPSDASDNQRRISSLLGLKRKFEACILMGEIVEDRFDKSMDADPETNQKWSPMEMTLDTSLRDMFIFECLRLINWACLCKKHGFLNKNSSVRAVCKLQKQVRGLRDYLMHEEQYVVAGEGRKPQRYLTEKEWGVLNPSSTITFVNSNVLGRQIEKEIHLGNKLEFFELFKVIQSSFAKADEDGLFDLSEEFALEEKLLQ